MELPADHAARKFIHIAAQSIDRASNLTQQLLTFAKGGDPLLAAMDLQEMLQNTIDFNLSGSNVKAVYHFPNNLRQVKADKGQISQAVANLTINAVEAMPDGGRLFVAVENTDNMPDNTLQSDSDCFVTVKIRDEGAGMSRELSEKIFDPYFSTKRVGSGLGLSIVHSIITKHNGYISVQSKRGAGTTFTIILPAEKLAATSEEASKQVRGTQSSVMGGHILVMDDEKVVRDVLMIMLETLGCTVEFADDGEEAVDKFVSADKSGNPFNIVVMDLTIPGGMGGKEAAQQVLAANPDALIIVSSGYSLDPVMANYEDYGFRGRLVKPFVLEDMRRELSRLIGPAE